MNTDYGLEAAVDVKVSSGRSRLLAREARGRRSRDLAVPLVLALAPGLTRREESVARHFGRETPCKGAGRHNRPS